MVLAPKNTKIYRISILNQGRLRQGVRLSSTAAIWDPINRLGRRFTTLLFKLKLHSVWSRLES